jgi:hypothetical protein
MCACMHALCTYIHGTYMVASVGLGRTLRCLGSSTCVCMCVRVRACVRACVIARVRAFCARKNGVRACVLCT